MKRLLIAGLFLAAPVLAEAGTWDDGKPIQTAAAPMAAMPRYDVEGLCRRHAEHGAAIGEKPDDGTRVSCLKRQQRMYDFIKARWDRILPEVREQCDAAARSANCSAGYGDYGCLGDCLDAGSRRRRDAKDAKDFKFRY